MTDDNRPEGQPPEGQFLLYQTEDGKRVLTEARV